MQHALDQFIGGIVLHLHLAPSESSACSGSSSSAAIWPTYWRAVRRRSDRSCARHRSSCQRHGRCSAGHRLAIALPMSEMWGRVARPARRPGRAQAALPIARSRMADAQCSAAFASQNWTETRRPSARSAAAGASLSRRPSPSRLRPSRSSCRRCAAEHRLDRASSGPPTARPRSASGCRTSAPTLPLRRAAPACRSNAFCGRRGAQWSMGRARRPVSQVPRSSRTS